MEAPRVMAPVAGVRQARRGAGAEEVRRAAPVPVKARGRVHGSCDRRADPGGTAPSRKVAVVAFGAPLRERCARERGAPPAAAEGRGPRAALRRLARRRRGQAVPALSMTLTMKVAVEVFAGSGRWGRAMANEGFF
eukprot:16432825-Heterocapsa_arctica.AAC.1